MELAKLGWIIVTILVLNKISFVSNVMVRVGTFQNLHRHPMLKSCADEALKENMYVGGRVHMLTGECEGLNRSWLLNQTVQSGYAYTKKVSIKESYIPPLENSYTVLTIPGVLREGAIVEVLFGELAPDYRELSIELIDTLDYITPYYSEHNNRVQLLSYTADRRYFGFGESKKSRDMGWGDVKCTPKEITKELKMSLRVHTGSIELFINDHKNCMFQPTIDLTTMRTVQIWVSSPVILHGVKFIDI